VPANQMRNLNLNQPGGICFDVNFDGLDRKGNLQWFRLAVDGAEVTTKLTWFGASDFSRATGCWYPPPPDGLQPGLHQVAVTVQTPSTPNEPTRQLVGWKFEVGP